MFSGKKLENLSSFTAEEGRVKYQPIKRERQSELIPTRWNPPTAPVSSHLCADKSFCPPRFERRNALRTELPSLPARTNTSTNTNTHTQPCHKACDVAYSPGMKGQTLHGKADGADLPGGSVLVPKAQLWPDSEEEAPSMERLLRKCRVRNELVRECLAECLGVYVLIVSLDYYYYNHLLLLLLSPTFSLRWHEVKRPVMFVFVLCTNM